MPTRVLTITTSVAIAAAGGWIYAGSGAPGPEPPPIASPAPAGPIDFDRDIRPILAERCWKCHGQAKHRAGLRLDSREGVLRGGESGPAAVPGASAESLLIQLVSGQDPDRPMPDDGPSLSDADIARLAAWIDQGLSWGAATATHKYALALRPVEIPVPSSADVSAHPLDRLIDACFREHAIEPPLPVDDRSYARRVFLDVIGLLPTPSELGDFLADTSPDKRARLARRLLADDRRYAEHWLTFWNDALRNDYQGTGYIDGGREQITQWLFDALLTNMPYDRFVSELVNPPGPASAGFAKGIVWRGVVNASQIPPMQAAQNVSQVFLGLNLKCASCHDSFINDWKLADAYGMAAAFADGPLEISRCDRPVGTLARAAFLYPELGAIDADGPRAERFAQLSALLIAKDNGRFTRTIVNRLWARLLGRGLVEPVDEMDNEPWSADVLDWLAADLIEHGYDLKRTLELILTSREYQLPAAPGAEAFDSAAAFVGPVVRRLTAEQFVDAVRTVTGVWPEKAAAQIRVGGAEGPYPGPIRAALLASDPLMAALGRPNREQVVTSRPGAATTLQAIELTNGAVLDALLREGAQRWLAEFPGPPEPLIDALYARALGRPPSADERRLALGLVGSPAQSSGVQDLLWAITMLPEFQLIR